MIKLKTQKLLAIALALAVFSTASIGVLAKSQNATEKNGTTSSTQSVVTDKSNKATNVTKPAPKETKIIIKATKMTMKTTKANVKVTKPQVKNGINNQLAGLVKKVNSIELHTNKIVKSIDAFILVNTTGSAINVTPSAITTTGSAIEVTKNKTAFINSTLGKLKALSNRLSSVEKNLKALNKKIDKTSNEQYKSLVSKIATIKVTIAKEIELLKTLKAQT